MLAVTEQSQEKTHHEDFGRLKFLIFSAQKNNVFIYLF